jgi:hypothetical protein
MNISSVQNVTFIGDIVESDKVYSGSKPVFYRRKLRVNYCNDLPRGFVNRHLSIVYFICINKEIYKIGQTSGKNGIKGCLSFYCGAGQDDPGSNRFTINALMREQLKKGNEISIYIKFMEPIEISLFGISKKHFVRVPISAKCLEEVHLEEYRSITGANPSWNFQESGNPTPAYINEQFASYRKMRAEARK